MLLLILYFVVVDPALVFVSVNVVVHDIVASVVVAVVVAVAVVVVVDIVVVDIRKKTDKCRQLFPH